MQSTLLQKLQKIDGRGYKSYKELEGHYNFPKFTLFCDYIQGDPFASPSRIRVRVPQKQAGFPEYLFSNNSRRTGLEDFLTRQLARTIKKEVKGNRGTGKSGLIKVDCGGQEVLERTALVVNRDYVEARITVGLPASGRRVLAGEARAMFFEELPAVVEKSLFYKNIDAREVANFVSLIEDQDHIRRKLSEMKLVAFVANGSVLPRKSGVSDLPMMSSKVIPFKSPPELEVTMRTPNRGEIKGMGIKEGITLIVGGGYHGKSTLLRAVERGVYNHIPGDGREFVITRLEAVKIRAEDGRGVTRVNISPFIKNLPNGEDTDAFSTEEASGSTSQAANIMEALEIGAKVLLLDEDTSATNFMIRDVRMQQLIAKSKEPITPFIDKVRQLYDELGVSTVIVIGGSGDYFDVADTVIAMDEYRPREVTKRAKQIALQYQTNRKREGGGTFGAVKERSPLPGGFNARRGGKIKIDARSLHTIRFGNSEILLYGIEQLVDISQTRAIGDAIYYGLKKYTDGKRTLKNIIERILVDIERDGLDILSPFQGQHPGDYALPRKFEIAAAVNRLRTLEIR